MIRIATGGKAGAGKDYVLERLCPYHAGQNGAYAIAGFGDLVRAELMSSHDPDYHPSRRSQQIYGQFRRQQDPNYWTYKALEWADSQPHGTVVGFSGVRFANEIEILKYGGFKVGLVEAPLEVRLLRLEQRDGRLWTDEEMNDVTETALDEIPRSAWDFIWDNS